MKTWGNEKGKFFAFKDGSKCLWYVRVYKLSVSWYY
jgi:hypothetical protein